MPAPAMARAGRVNSSHSGARVTRCNESVKPLVRHALLAQSDRFDRIADRDLQALQAATYDQFRVPIALPLVVEFCTFGGRVDLARLRLRLELAVGCCRRREQRLIRQTDFCSRARAGIGDCTARKHERAPGNERPASGKPCVLALSQARRVQHSVSAGLTQGNGARPLLSVRALPLAARAISGIRGTAHPDPRGCARRCALPAGPGKPGNRD